MIKNINSRIVITIFASLVMVVLSYSRLNAETTDKNSLNINNPTQTETSNMIAQTTETRSSVTSSTTEDQIPVEERRSVTTTTRSATEAAPAKKPHCDARCLEQYNQSMNECNLPDHPNHKKCEKWAREREKECLDKCYGE